MNSRQIQEMVKRELEKRKGNMTSAASNAEKSKKSELLRRRAELKASLLRTNAVSDKINKKLVEGLIKKSLKEQIKYNRERGLPTEQLEWDLRRTKEIANEIYDNPEVQRALNEQRRAIRTSSKKQQSNTIIDSLLGAGALVVGSPVNFLLAMGLIGKKTGEHAIKRKKLKPLQEDIRKRLKENKEKLKES